MLQAFNLAKIREINSAPSLNLPNIHRRRFNSIKIQRITQIPLPRDFISDLHRSKRI